MSLHKIKNGIQNRSAKIKEMCFRFEPDAQIELYKTTSLKILREDYIDAVRSMQDADRSRLADIEAKYRKQQAPLTERAQRVVLTQNELRSLSLSQLKKRAQEAQAFPPALTDPIECQCISAELRNRNASDEADQLSGWVVAQRVAEPWVHDPSYQSLEKRVTKLDVYRAQAEEGTMLVLSDDVDRIGETDICFFEEIDEGLPEVSS